MRAFVPNARWTYVLLVASLCVVAAPARLLADEKGSTDGSKERPANSAAVNSDSAKPAKSDAAAAGLTERERLLLDRVEQLEKRVAELEANKQPAATSAAPPGDAKVVASQPGSVNFAASPAPIANTTAANLGAKSATPERMTETTNAASGPAAPAGGNAISNDQVMASIGPQATEAGKSGSAKAPVEEPFSFADFTWLNGNARTKDIPMDTKIFTPEIRTEAPPK